MESVPGVVFCLRLSLSLSVSIVVMKTTPKRQVEEGRVYLAYVSKMLVTIRGSQEL